ncbi:phage tail tape measure protein [Pseudomonas sp. RAC1]|uniref:phage tail tape measure protein n=1 Tax=Pseudomonas sp. RAC1 TaxID=3064900 RepID=UPI0027290767|nr:phage tail tape measure protein [Pseudomonas sp. RAC1]MDV9031378.1 phage tail tape measure protein [Pseudomonas sp. RAC1]
MALKSRLELEVDGRSAEQQVNDIRAALEALEQAGVRASSTLRKSGGEFTNLAMSLAKVQAANDRTATATDTAAKSADAAAKSAASQRKELDALLGKIDPLTKKLNELAAQEAALAQARNTGQINTATFDAYSLKLQDSLNALAGVSRAQTAVGETADQARQRILGVADAAVKAAQEQRNLANVATGLSEAEQGLLSGNMVLAANQGKLAQSSQKVAEANRQAQAAIGGQADSLQELLASIDPTTRALNRLDEQERKLAQQKKIGALGAETFAQYQGKINQARSALSSFDDSLNRTGNTAKQNAAALRMLPAQFSDIFISLQGGQAPLTVFLQQGSQIKDSFGGIGAAAKAMGGYVLSLVTPFSLAAAAGVALGYAFYKGSQEADRFNDSLTLTGGAAGLTSDQLGAMAKQVSAVVGSTGAAASALAQISGGGKIAGESFQQVALAAVSMKEATGKAVSDTIAEFVKIADEPVKASAALNSQYHYLTGSIYSQITALEEQGKHADAVKLATDAFADAINNRTPKIIENLSFWERGYNAVAKAADRLKDIGRSNVDDDIAQAEADLARAQKGDVGFFQDKDKMVEFYTDQLNFLKDTKAAQEDLAQYDKDQAEANERSVKAMEYVDSAEKSARTNAEKRADALKKYEQALDRIRAKNPEDPRLSADRVARVKSNIAEQYKDPKTPKAPKYREDAGQKMLDNARQRYAVLQQQTLAISGELGQTQKLGVEARKLVELETEIANLKEKKTLTTSQKQILAMAEMNLAQQKQNAELERANELTKERYETEAKLRAFRENLQSQLSTAREGQAVELEGYGQGDKLRQRLQEDLKIRQEYQRELDKVTRDYNRISNPTASDTALYQGQTEALRSALSTRLSDQQAYYAQVDKLQSDWTVGATQAMNTYAEQAADVASQTRNLFSSAFGNMEDAVVNFVKTGKLSFKDFADQVVADLIRIQVRQAAAGFLNMAIGAGISAFGGGAGAASSAFAPGSAGAISSKLGASAAGYSAKYGFSEGGYTGPGGINEPAGIVHKGEVVWSQDDVRRFGGVQAVEGLRTGNVSPTGSGKTTASSLAAGASTGGQSGGLVIKQEITVQGTADEATLARIQQAAQKGAQDGYNLVLRDFKQNGPARQLIARR